MSDPQPGHASLLATVQLRAERDVVLARQRSRQLAAALGLDRLEQTRIASAVSEVAAGAARAGRVEFFVAGPELRIAVIGTPLGLDVSTVRPLVDRVEVEGPCVLLSRALEAPPRDVAELGAQLAAPLPPDAPDPVDELLQQNRELVAALADVREKGERLTQLNRELEDTNRGVVALYAELDIKAESLQRATETKSRFLSHMSHEFRTPVNSILSLSRLLLDGVEGPLNPGQEKAVSLLRRSADDLAGMVNDLLDLARAEAGKLQVRAAPFDAANVLGALRGVSKPVSHSQAVQLVIDEPAVPLQLHTDEGKVSQIVRNFVSNALKFTERGEVRVRAFAAGPGSVSFAVSDTGIGIARQDVPRIFEEFSQVDGPLQRKVKGTGLGLPLSRRLAEMLGGSIAVESEPGVGSTFTLTIPATYSGPGEAQLLGAAPPAHAGAGKELSHAT